MDVRTQGSGNAGATNTFRVLGKKAGIFVLLFDILKGYWGTSLASILVGMSFLPESDELLFKMIFGLATVLGHIYPVFAGFRGGKGVATLLGMVFCISPLAGGICVGIFLILFSTLHFVSVGSMVAALCFAVMVLLGFCGPANTPTQIMALLLAALVVYTHRTNIQKLKLGTENRMYLIKKVKSEELKVKS